ncbi:uncharacterized protein LOC108092133 isoform X1 [Drosophila ficusphila]|uniref:uncharacterized protein LOC108092133 isoform X1 n=1 Tax=Drosophila ficusphila TaxID=30025 RepID=UPI0007E72C73|nr:uncharacterized protein LOC108092133 isoform X1 [Drosophila ficusphila]
MRLFSEMPLAFWCCLSITLSSVLAIIIPEHNCNDYFTYSPVHYGESYIGVFTAPKTNSTEKFYWEAYFNAHGRADQVDDLKPYPNNIESFINVKRGNPPQMYVDFMNITNELPLLIEFKLNGETLCSNPKYPIPRTITRVARSMDISDILKSPNVVYKMP